MSKGKINPFGSLKYLRPEEKERERESEESKTVGEDRPNLY
jgi:hypothetical protein